MLLSREKCKMLQSAEEKLFALFVSCIFFSPSSYFPFLSSFSRLSLLFFAAIQLERNHDKLMQKRGNKRSENQPSSVETVRWLIRNQPQFAFTSLLLVKCRNLLMRPFLDFSVQLLFFCCILQLTTHKIAESELKLVNKFHEQRRCYGIKCTRVSSTR